MNPNVSRRQFLASAALAAGGLAVPGCSTPRSTAASGKRIVGANEDVRVAVIGFNGRGTDHINGFTKLKGVRLVGLCDCDRNVLDKGAAELAAKGIHVEKFTDVRKLLERGDIDVISTATPNHWHALIAIWACQHGKDVYVEKPVSHNAWEGRQIVKAARKYGRIVQTGTQSRSNPGLREAVEWVQAGNLGKIKLARGLCYKPRQSIGKVAGPTPLPPNIDYDLWCGPSPMNPLMRAKLHYDWHWQFVTGNGDLGNQGIHQMDIARWALGEHSLSPSVFSVGGRFGYVDDGNTPNSQFVYHGFKRAPLIFEVRGLPKAKEFQMPALWNKNMDVLQGASIGVIVECEGGYLSIPSYDSAVAYDRTGHEVKRWKGGADHYANFIGAVRSRRPHELNAEIEEGHLSSGLCHTANVSYQLGESLAPGAIRERLQGNSAASETFGRLNEHLGANGIDQARTPITLGAFLEMDTQAERFTGSSRRANPMLTREYRRGFEVPARV
ncbi:MAG: Gfo/Idh/MocA family oxidoreductase [Pedosphaera sp.]|nr:Gfo/Idh/MocA family oxidoreductase [Pedosphaera sp.]